jgi:tRNA threonylcarbamoyladenosine biosynthesis protein TsaB
VIVLGVDTATSATAVGLRLADGTASELRDDPPRGSRPGHATRLLPMAVSLLEAAGIGWDGIERVAVGVGPGTFTGLRVGIATARGLAQSLGLALAGISSLAALAEPALEALAPASVGSAPRDAGAVLAVLDARRGEVFAAAYTRSAGGAGVELTAPRALAPPELPGLLVDARAAVGADAPLSAVGDGALLYRAELEAAGAAVPCGQPELHRIAARATCAAGARVSAAARLEDVLPDYRRRPDAELALERSAEHAAAG